jgi:hypothetical protein
MKRKAVIRKIKDEAKRRGLSFSTVELGRHTGIIVDGFRSTLARHREIPEPTARAFFDQFADQFGKGWWR